MRRKVPVAWILTIATWMAGCFASHGTPDDANAGGDRDNVDGGKRGLNGTDAGDDATPEDVVCDGRAHDPSNVTPSERVDLLFVVDDSPSMREEQVHLRTQLPSLLRSLLSGDLDSNGTLDMPPAADVHIGVISADLGASGATDTGSCAGFGDNGALLHASATPLPGCQHALPAFLRATGPGLTDVPELAADLGCMATLGVEGCGHEQPLEAALHALWPSRDPAVTFVSGADGDARLGLGDLDNAAFDRDCPRRAPSMLAIVLITDEDDCSTAEPSAFAAAPPLGGETDTAERRCHLDARALFGLERYVEGFRALRPGQTQRLFFGAVVGVPPDLVDATARAGVDFGSREQRDAYYDTILSDPRMQQRPAPGSNAAVPQELTPACATDFDFDRVIDARAYPARRIVEVAKQLGRNTALLSICNPDFGAVLDPLFDALRHLAEEPEQR